MYTYMHICTRYEPTCTTVLRPPQKNVSYNVYGSIPTCTFDMRIQLSSWVGLDSATLVHAGRFRAKVSLVSNAKYFEGLEFYMYR